MRETYYYIFLGKDENLFCWENCNDSENHFNKNHTLSLDNRTNDIVLSAL